VDPYGHQRMLESKKLDDKDELVARTFETLWM
jgi:hypothetical protein